MALPPGYPLAAVDANGKPLQVGQMACVPLMPSWLLDDLPADEVARLRAVEGVALPIHGFDAYGYVWFGQDGPWFCVRPGETMAVTEPA